MLRFISPRLRRQDGVSLIALAVLMAIVGIVLASYLRWWDVQLQKQHIETTKKRLAAIHVAITDYLIQHKRYPCPENPVAPSGAATRFEGTNPNEDDDCAPDDPLNANSPKTPVWRGVVPVRALRLSANDAIDGWGNKISYAVTRSLTTPEVFKAPGPHFGLLRVYDHDMKNVLTLQDKGRYVIFSHGPSGAGAWTPGGLKHPCTPETKDGYNCNGDRIFIKAPFSTAPGPDFYDDILLTDDYNDRSLVERIAVCNDLKGFYSPQDGARDQDGCIYITNTWHGSCTVASAPGATPPAGPSAKALLPPAAVSGSGCTCPDKLKPFNGGEWDQQQAPYTRAALTSCTPDHKLFE